MRNSLRFVGLRRVVGSVLATAGLWFVSASAIAQSGDDWLTWSQLVKRYDRFSQAGDWENAAPQADRIASFTRQRFPARLEYAGLMWVAQSRNGLGEYQEAFKLYEQTYQLCRQSQPQSTQEQKIHSIATAESLRGMGIACERLGRLQDAVGYVSRAVDFHLRQKDHRAASETRSNLASMYRQLGDYDLATREYRQAVAAMEPFAAGGEATSVDRHILARALTGLAESYTSIGRYDLAEPLARRALQIMVSVHGIEHMRTAEILNTIGLILDSQGRIEEAGEYYQGALELWEKTQGPEHHSTAMGLLNLAGVRQHQEKYSEAEAMLRRALGIWRKRLGANHPDTAFGEYHLGSLLALMGPTKYRESEELLQHATATLEANLGLNHPNVAMALFAQATLRFVQGNYVRTLEVADRIAKIHEQHPLPDYQLRKLHGLRASIYWSTGKRDEALKEGQSAIEVGEEVRVNASGAERERATVFEPFGVDFDELIHWYAELNRPAEMFKTIERRKSRSFLDELRLKHVDLLRGIEPVERQRLLSREQELRKQLLAAERQFEELGDSDSSNEADAAARIKQAGVVRRARNGLYQHLTEMRAASPTYRELITAKSESPGLSQAQALLGPDEAMLVYSLSLDHSYVVVVRSGQSRFAELTVSNDIAAALGIEPGPLTRDSLSHVLLNNDGVLPAISSLSKPDEFQRALAKLASLWKLLIPNEEQASLKDGSIKLLTIVPDGPLAMLPFEALVVDNTGDSSFLLDVGPPIAYAPSVAVLMNLAARERRATTASEPVLSVGNPTYRQVTQAQHPDRLRAAEGFRAGLSQLPYTGWEATWVEQQFGKVNVPVLKLTGAAATEAAAIKQVAGREIVHFACHGMADQTYGNFFGTLALTPGKSGDPRDDGFLSMSEIYELPLAGCELAILSACHTNYGPQQQGEGTWALSRGFLVAGARRVVASNWVVNDQAGASLVNYFALYLARAGKDATARDYARSLHEAKKAVRNEEKWSNPFYWSSLVLVGPK